MINLICPECGEELNIVPDSKCLNPEQYDSVKAGDYYCTNCKGDRGKTGFRYYWKEELNNSQNSNKHYNKIINNLVECLKEACEMANESGPVPLKWKKAIIMATEKIE